MCEACRLFRRNQTLVRWICCYFSSLNFVDAADRTSWSMVSLCVDDNPFEWSLIGRRALPVERARSTHWAELKLTGGNSLHQTQAANRSMEKYYVHRHDRSQTNRLRVYKSRQCTQLFDYRFDDDEEKFTRFTHTISRVIAFHSKCNTK